MPKSPRKAIAANLWKLLSTATWLAVDPTNPTGPLVSTTWATADPRLHLPDEVPGSSQPALFLVKPKESVSQTQTFGLPGYRLTYMALILLQSAGTTEDVGNRAEDQMDDILDAFEQQLMYNQILPDGTVVTAPPGEKQTLGGLVTACYVDGEITIDTPVLFSQCAVWIPITVVVGL